MKTYTCDRCRTTIENPIDWITIDLTPLHSSKHNLSEIWKDEKEYHYCRVCSYHIRGTLTEVVNDADDKNLP